MGQGEFKFPRPPAASAGKRPSVSRSTRAQRSTEPTPSNVPAPNKSQPTGVYSVTQLTRLIKLTLNAHLPGRIVVTGEISNFVLHRSGHLYLTLKDENAQIAAVMWRSTAAQLKFQPTDGLAVQATGRVDIYEPQGKYQFYIDKLEPAGIGALELAFRQLTEKLRREGLFDEIHKKSLPSYPETIALVTSPEGAAIKDITQTLKRRFPVVRKLFWPVAVQGESAAVEIARALRDINRRSASLGGIDLIILARGGGSLEDLWAFNEEIVARAAFDSTIPVITGIGHEVDITIADLVADRRAATPTAAAELAVPVRTDLLQDLDDAWRRLFNVLSRRYTSAADKLDNLRCRPMFSHPLDLVHHRQQFIDEQTADLARKFSDSLRQAERSLENRAMILRRIEPHYALHHARAQLMEHRQLLHLSVRQFLQAYRHHLENTMVQLRASSPRRLLPQQRVILAHLCDCCCKASAEQIRHRYQHLEGCLRRLENLDPRAVLRRGYSITRWKETGKIITPQLGIKPGDLLLTELAQETQVESEVTSVPIKRKDNHG